MPEVVRRYLRGFVRDESGAATILGLFIFTACAMVGAIGLDVTYLRATKTQLQIAADQAAHAALYRRNKFTREEAITDALGIVTSLLSDASFDKALLDTDVEFGVYNRETDLFVPLEASRTAVRVRTRLETARENRAKTFLFRMIGIYDFDISAESIYATYLPGCLREGFIARGVVDLQSGNSFSDGFCVHSNTYVSLNQNNYFEPGTVVSMPNIDDLDLPQSGFEKNEGLQEALRNQRMNIRVLDEVRDLDLDLTAGSDVEIPAYITSLIVEKLNTRKVSMTDLLPGRMYDVGCPGQNLTIEGPLPIVGVVIVTDCEVNFANGSALEDAMLVTTSMSAKSISAPNGMRIGRDDNCADGGGAQIVTEGGMEVASGLEMFGGQVIAQGDVTFAANANGIQGASIIAGGKIEGTSNSSFGFCNTGMDVIEVDYFRMVK